MSDKALEGRPQGAFANLRRRLYLTYVNYGARTVLFRLLTFPLRFTPLAKRMRLRSHARDQEVRRAATWYREHGRPVDIVIPSFRDAERVRTLVRSISKTVGEGMTRVIVADDASGEEHLAALRAHRGIEIVTAAEGNVGFAANTNRGLRASDPERDVVVLNSDVEALPRWLECLQYAAYRYEDGGIVGAQLQYPDGRIQFGGTVRNRDQPEWFDHRYRFKPRGWGPADQTSPAIAVTGACMYVRREVIERIGLLDERYAMAYEDVDWCLRAWQAGFRVLYFPSAQLIHHESVTRGTDVGERERESQRLFWERWSSFFDPRSVRSGLRRRGAAANRLRDRGHRCRRRASGHLRAPQPPRRARTRGLAVHARAGARVVLPARSCAQLRRLRSPFAGARRGGRDQGGDVVDDRGAGLAGEHPAGDTRLLRTGHRDLLLPRPRAGAPRGAGLIPPRVPLHDDLQLESRAAGGARPRRGADTAGDRSRAFRPRTDVPRREDMVLALGRSNPLKNLPLTLAAWRTLRQPRPELCLFGIEPELATEEGVHYVESPDDERVNELLCQATVFVQTSSHEGFALPPLEAMATGAAIVCTDAHGNRDFCVDGVNCLMPEASAREVGSALERLLSDPELRTRLGRAGIETAGEYAWERRIDALERFFRRVAASRRMALHGEVQEIRQTQEA